MKKFLDEFKAFALKGNVLDLAVAVIIGAAFQGIINSVVNDLINPLLSLILRADFSGLFVRLSSTVEVTGEDGAASTVATSGLTLTQLEEYGAPVFKYGAFINALINFVIMAFVIFLIVKGMNKLSSLGHKKTEPAAPTTRKCPFCCTDVAIEATRCPHCTSQLEAIKTAKVDKAEDKPGKLGGLFNLHKK